MSEREKARKIDGNKRKELFMYINSERQTDKEKTDKESMQNHTQRYTHTHTHIASCEIFIVYICVCVCEYNDTKLYQYQTE